MIEARTSEPAATEAFAGAFAGLCRPGDLILLVGDMGAGKTVFCRGLGAALGVTRPVTSPTFTLANEYPGPVPVHHLDVYRITDLDEVRDLALPELLDGDAVTVIEWGDTIGSLLPNDRLEIALTFGEGDDDRDIVVTCVGERWAARSRALRDALAPWAVASC